MGFEERAEVSRGEERWDARQGNRDNGMVGAGGQGGKFYRAHQWNLSFEKTCDVVFGPCSIVNDTDKARGKAPHIGVGISSSPEAGSEKYLPCTKMLFLRSRQTEIVVKAIDVELLQVFSKLHWLPQVKCSSLHWCNFSWYKRQVKGQ